MLPSIFVIDRAMVSSQRKGREFRRNIVVDPLLFPCEHLENHFDQCCHSCYRNSILGSGLVEVWAQATGGSGVYDSKDRSKKGFIVILLMEHTLP